MTPTDEGKRIAVIRTSDRIQFKQCRRKWNWGSHLRGNLKSKQKASPLWFGSGIHFALEDFHGKQRFPSASAAFTAYAKATYKQNASSLPDDAEDLVKLSMDIMDYYQNYWLKYRKPLDTFGYNGVPQTEVTFEIEIPGDWSEFGYDRVLYRGTFDRIIIDEHGILWIMEYKTAKVIQTMHYQTDPQVAAYIWAANIVYPGYQVGGVCYQQHRKEGPNAPCILKNGSISTAANQKTSHALYREALIDMYGEVSKAPSENVRCLNELAQEETEDRDPFIRRDWITKNARASESEGVKILMEVEDMLNPNLALYPNPVRECVYRCDFHSACVSLDDGYDWQYELEDRFISGEKDWESWRKFMVLPDGSPGWQRIEHVRTAPFGRT
jgi:hypothetical protein